MTVYRMTILSLVTGLVTVSLAAVTSAHTAPQAPRDRQMVRRYVYHTIFDNSAVRVDQGVVTLMGQVREGIGKRDLARIVSQVPGVKAVDNQIEVLPAGGDRVRARVAARIYGHPQFQKYTFYRNPPIRIIVRRADVTLAGVVNSPLEKQLAQHLALHTFGVLTVTNELQVEGKAASH